MSRRRTRWAACVFLLLAIGHTWPLITGLDHLSRPNDDEWLNAWAVSWIAHQLPRDPVHLFDANIFYPNERTLRYTEPLIAPALLGAPLRWLGASPMLTYNVLVLLGLTLTALAMYVLVFHWSGDHWAGLLAGALLAYSTPMLTRLPHLQALHIYSLPLACLALDRLLVRRRWRDAAWLGVFVLVAALTSGYLAVFVTFALGGAFLARAPSWWGRQGVGLLMRLAAAGAITLGVLLLLLRPYQGLLRSLPLEAASIGALLESYLASAANLHYAMWSRPFFERAPGTLFPGLLALGLAAVALTIRRRVAPDGVRPMLVAIAATGLVLSLGALTPIYVWASWIVPPLQGLRAPNRFGIVVLFALAALAGLGMSALRQRTSPRWRTSVSFGLLAVATVESLHAPIPYISVGQTGAIYGALDTADPGAVVELPIYWADTFHLNARYLLASTTHWRPLVNGFGGFRPSSYDGIAEAIATFPSFVAVARLQQLGVRYVVVHSEEYRRPEEFRATLAQAEQRADLVLVAQDGPDQLYRVADQPRTSVGEMLFTLPWSDLTFVQVQSPGSYLRASYAIGRAFGLQGPDELVALVEDTTETSRLMLRLPTPMTGMFLDAVTGDVLGELTVEASLSTDPPTRVDVPTDLQAVILRLKARD